MPKTLRTLLAAAALALAGGSSFAQSVPTCSSSDISGSFNFLSCSGYTGGNLISNSPQDIQAVTTWLSALYQPFGVTVQNVTVAEKLNFSGSTSVIDFNNPLQGRSVIGIHKGGGGSGDQATGFYLIDSTTLGGVNQITYNLSALSNAALYTVNTAPVPEPGTWALLVAGLGDVGFVARRRRPALR